MVETEEHLEALVGGAQRAEHLELRVALGEIRHALELIQENVRHGGIRATGHGDADVFKRDFFNRVFWHSYDQCRDDIVRTFDRRARVGIACARCGGRDGDGEIADADVADRSCGTACHPLHAPRPSSTGKTLTVASSNGNKETEARIDGKPVIVGVNAYIKPVG